MLSQNSHEPFHRSQDCSVHNNRSSESFFQLLFFPDILFIAQFVFWENLFAHFDLFCWLFIFYFLLFSSCFTLILQVKSNWKLEVKLNCSTLMSTSKCIIDLDINFWSIESPLSLISFPRFAAFIESICERLFCDIPQCIITKTFIWSRSCGKLKIIFKAEQIINVIQEI